MMLPMQAVILAAGRGTRMKELTETIPKPLLLVLGKSLLEHKLAALPDEVDEVIIVVGYQGDQIKERLGDSAHGKKIRYVVQEKLDGTAGALWKAQPLLQGQFLVLMADDIYSREDIEKCMRNGGWIVVVEPTDAMAAGGSVVTDEAGMVVDIKEGDHRGEKGLMNTNFFLLDERFFSHPPMRISEGSEEYGLPQTAVVIAKRDGIPFKAIETSFWIRITSPEDLVEAEKRLRAKMSQ